MEKFDLIIIGGGPGGYEAAIEAAKKYGKKVALVESRELGGTCLNRGCIPTKTLLHTIGIYSEIKAHGEEIGLTGSDVIGVSLAALHSRKNAVLEQLRTGIASLMKMNKITVYEGRGSIIDSGKIEVKLNSGETCELSCDDILIASGSVPAMPPIKGADLKGVVTSDELLDLAEPIESITIIGGGVIGCEFASLFGLLGVKVTVVEALDKIIANLDRELSQNLKMLLSKGLGADIHTGALVTEIKESGNGLITCFTEKESPVEVCSDLVLMAVGRKPETTGLFSDKSSEAVKNIEMNRTAVAVNERYETSVNRIYAIGDVIGGIQLAHTATAEGRNAVAIICGEKPEINMNVVPSCIYTQPEIASVGIGPDIAKQEGLEVVSKKYTMSANGKTVLSLGDRGFIRVTADKETGRILGAQMMCERATDMISQFTQAIVNELTLEDITKIIFPHPTFSEAIGEAVR